MPLDISAPVEINLTIKHNQLARELGSTADKTVAGHTCITCWQELQNLTPFNQDQHILLIILIDSSHFTHLTDTFCEHVPGHPRKREKEKALVDTRRFQSFSQHRTGSSGVVVVVVALRDYILVL